MKTAFKFNSFTECRRVAELMKSAGFFISAHTIARFLGVIQPARKPYVSTLDLISGFLGYKGWNEFTLSKNRPRNIYLTDAEGRPDLLQLKQIRLSRALISGDHRDMMNILNCISNEDISQNWQDLSFLIGWFCRGNATDKKLFRSLAENPVGRELFYRTFVDEDDPCSYYSHYLQSCFLKTARSDADRVFALSFLNTRSIYAGKGPAIPVPKGWNDLDPATLLVENGSYHLISRYFEHRLNMSSSRCFPEKTINEMLGFIERFQPREFAWILGRSLRALFFHGHAGLVLKHDIIGNACKWVLLSIPGELHNTAEILIQLTYFAGKYSSKQTKEVLPKKSVVMLTNDKEKATLDHMLMFLLGGTEICRTGHRFTEVVRRKEQWWACPLAEHLCSDLSN